VLRVTGVVVAVGLATAGSSAYAFAAGARSGQKASGQEVSGRAVSSQPPAGLQQAADQLVADGVPGVIIMTRRGQQVSNVVAGLADKATGQPMQPQDMVRIGSITKTFVATVVLQLAAERRLSLNDSVQKWLPGVITGHGYHRPRSPSASCYSRPAGYRTTRPPRGS
jgi:D-alanyl-D-alanine carboxypeptidase